MRFNKQPHKSASRLRETIGANLIAALAGEVVVNSFVRGGSPGEFQGVVRKSLFVVWQALPLPYCITRKTVRLSRLASSSGGGSSSPSVAMQTASKHMLLFPHTRART